MSFFFLVLLKMVLIAHSPDFQYLYTDGRFNISTYNESLLNWENSIKSGDKMQAKLGYPLAGQWYREHPLVYKSWFDKRDGQELFLSPAIKNCPEETGGVFLWERPENQKHTKECLNILKERRKVLLSATKPAKQGYPSIRGYFRITLDATTYYTRSKNDSIFETQLQVLNKSGLLNHSSLVLQIGLLNKNVNHSRTQCVKKLIESRIQEFAKDTQVQYVDPYGYECGTIRSLRSWCGRNKSSFVFYLHNKGFTHAGQGFVYLNLRHWREFMMFFLFERWYLCANSLLHGAKTCGVKKEEIPFQHYSGNFWWSSCDYIARVKTPCPSGNALRHAAEFWLISDVMLLNETRAALELWHGTPGYFDPYPRDRYDCADLLIQNRSLFSRI